MVMGYWLWVIEAFCWLLVGCWLVVGWLLVGCWLIVG
jgi:hypothetical protein